VDAILARCGQEIEVAAPLGLGKPLRLLNALYDRVAAEPVGACTSTPRSRSIRRRRPPRSSGASSRRSPRGISAPISRAGYTVAQKRDALPPNVHVEEFYVQSGAMLGSTQAQSSYNALNYTHVARAVRRAASAARATRLPRPRTAAAQPECNPT
jgi:hypothetical protein